MLDSLALVLPNGGVHATAKLRRDPPGGYRSFARFSQSFARLAKGDAASASDYSVDDSPVPLFDQGRAGTCVANSVCAASEIALVLQGNAWRPLSRLWLNWLCGKAQGTLGQDVGTTGALAVDRATTIGFCDEAFWPYTDDPARLFVPPPGAVDAVLEGADNRMTDKFRIESIDGMTKVDQIEVAIRANHTPIFGTPVDSSIQSYQPGQVLTQPDTSRIIGGHEMVFTGVRRVNGARQLKIRNSWSAAWGEGGYAWIDESFAEWPELGDVWVLTRQAPLVF